MGVVGSCYAGLLGEKYVSHNKKTIFIKINLPCYNNFSTALCHTLEQPSLQKITVMQKWLIAFVNVPSVALVQKVLSVGKVECM